MALGLVNVSVVTENQLDLEKLMKNSTDSVSLVFAKVIDYELGNIEKVKRSSCHALT